MLKKTFVAAALLIVAAAIAMPAAAYADPYAGALSDNSAAPGSTITYSPDTGNPNTSGDAALSGETDGSPVGGSIEQAVYGVAASGHFVTSSTGHLTLRIKLPTNAHRGSTFSLAVNAGTFHASPAFTIASPISPSAALSFTGFNALPYIWFGGGLVALGAALVIVLGVVRRNRRIPSQA